MKRSPSQGYGFEPNKNTDWLDDKYFYVYYGFLVILFRVFVGQGTAQCARARERERERGSAPQRIFVCVHSVREKMRGTSRVSRPNAQAESNANLRSCQSSLARVLGSIAAAASINCAADDVRFPRSEVLTILLLLSNGFVCLQASSSSSLTSSPTSTSGRRSTSHMPSSVSFRAHRDEAAPISMWFADSLRPFVFLSPVRSRSCSSTG
jgi:hypothetical protein